MVFARYLYEVALLPLSPPEILAAGRQEWDRAVGFELFEQHRVPDASWPPMPAGAADQARAEALAEGEVRRYYEAHDLLTQPTSLCHYLNAPLPAYLEPLRWLGVTDDLTGPDRLDQDGFSYVPVPSPALPYFYRANAADPRAGIVHEGAHFQQLALAWRHPRSARRHFYDSCPNEGIAFYNEEMLTQAGLFDAAPASRRIIYNFMRLRALRVEIDVGLALGQLSVEDAGALLERRVPMDRGTARSEAAFFAATPAQGLSYTIGKLQLLRLLADARTEEGSSFSLREFHDWIWRNGNVPFALLRYDRLGDRSDLDRVDELRAGYAPGPRSCRRRPCLVPQLPNASRTAGKTRAPSSSRPPSSVIPCGVPKSIRSAPARSTFTACSATAPGVPAKANRWRTASGTSFEAASTPDALSSWRIC